MSKKMISALLVLFMVLNLIAGFPVMAEETAGEITESILENEPAAEGISGSDAGPAVNAEEDSAAVPEESAAAYDTEAGEEEETAEAQEEQPSVETGDGNASAVNVDSDTASSADEEPAKAEDKDTTSDPVQAESDAAKKAVNEKSKPAESSKTAAEPALVGAGEESRETVEMRVWTPGHGRVLVNGSDYGTEFSGTWDKGTEVSVEAVPDSGYMFNHWWVRKENGSGEWVRTADDTLIAGADSEAAAYFGLETAYMTITPPAAGTTAAQAPQVSFPSDAGYGLVSEASDGFSLQWVTGSNLYGRQVLDPGTTFEAGETYYAYVCLSDGNDSFAATAGGSTFNTDLQVTGGEKIDQSNSAVTEAGGGAYIWIQAIIAVTIPEADTHTVTFDMRGHYTEVASQKVADGEKAVKPASPVNYDKASDYDTTGLRFRMWHEDLPGDLTYDTLWNNAYNFQEPITEDKTLYAIYESILTLRTYDLTNSAERKGGTITWSDVYWRVPQTESSIQTTIIEGTQETLTANTAEGYTFVGWSSSTSREDIVSTDSTYTFTNEGRRTVYALFEEEAPLEDLTFDFQIANGAGMSLTDIVSSFTVNGEDWLLPVSGMQVSRQIAAGSTVVAVMNAGDNALLSDAALPDGLTIDDFMVASSEDGSGLTVAFTMPEDAVVIVVDAKRAVTINYDVNGGTKGPAWPGDLIKIPYTMGYIGSVIVVDVGNDLVNPETGEDVAIPPDGCRYAGLEVTDKNGAHTGALGQRITGLNFSEGATFKILWEKDTTVTVTFHANGGTPEPAAQTFAPGGKADEPAAPTKEGGFDFGGWYKDEGYGEAFSFDSEVTEDLDLYARWNGKLGVFTYDRTGNEVEAGGTFDYVTAEAAGEGVTNFDTDSIAEGTAVTLTAHPAEGWRFVGWAKDKREGTILCTDASYEFTFSKTPTILFAVFEKTLTIHWSSVDGVDLMDPIEIPFTAGRKLGDILEDAGYSLYDYPYEKDGYMPEGLYFDRPITECSSYEELTDFDEHTVVNDSMDIYAVMLKTIDAVELTIEPPVCGTVSEVPEGGNLKKDQTNPPAVSVPDGANYGFNEGDGYLPAYWIPEAGSEELEFVGGEEYNAYIALKAAYGYGFAVNPEWHYTGGISVNGGEFLETESGGGHLLVYLRVSAAHDPADSVVENTVEPSCTKVGSHDEVVHCKGCSAELSRTTVEDAALGHNWGEWTETKAPTCTEPGEETRTCERCSEKETRVIDAVGHDWGEWVVTKEVTDTEDGEETRTCTRCKETETRTIPHLVVEYRNTRGDGSTWEKGSSDALEFVFNRSIEDEKAFSHFTGLQVDGKDLDAANYMAVSGSVVVKLKPEYLGTLSAGKHTITAFFDDGNDPSAEFTINEKKQAAAPTPAKTSGTTTVTKKSSQSAGKGSAKSPKTGDSSSPLLWISLLGVSLFAIAKGVSSRRKAKR
ncbi:MAG: InlB B-repeat-containing protein [Eubacteriales bacterium]